MIEERTSIQIDKDEIKNCLQEYLKEKGYDIESIVFNTILEEDENDYLSQSHDRYDFSGATIITKNNIKK